MQPIAVALAAVTVTLTCVMAGDVSNTGIHCQIAASDSFLAIWQMPAYVFYRAQRRLLSGMLSRLRPSSIVSLHLLMLAGVLQGARRQYCCICWSHRQRQVNSHSSAVQVWFFRCSSADTCWGSTVAEWVWARA